MFLLLLLAFAWARPAAAAYSSTQAELGLDADALLMSGDYDRLESLADEYRTAGARVPGGNPKSFALYDALAAFSGTRCVCSGHASGIAYEAKHETVEKWLAQMPDSVAAHIVMAQLWVNHAWSERGIDYADKVRPGQWRGYYGGLLAAWTYISGLDPARDSYLYYLRSELIEIAPSPRKALEANFAAAIRHDPDDLAIYAQKAFWLQEKWYGDPGELAQFTHKLLQKPGGDTGLLAYETVAAKFYNVFATYHLIKMVGVDWPTLKKAFFLKESRYGFSQTDWNAAMAYTLASGDTAFGDEELDHARDRAMAGSAFDQNNLGAAYLGIGKAEQATRWFGMAASHGDAIGEYNLGSLFEHLMPPQYKRALAWYALSAQQGYSTATNNIAYMYENGLGVGQDYVQAAKLYREVAEKGQPRAQFHLGTLYDRGAGVPKDEGQALAWIRKAANLGDAEAKQWLTAHAAEAPVPSGQ